eukprot:scaffold1239_cov175-Pinguiococcus_pyrenoidosus.AAC.43
MEQDVVQDPRQRRGATAMKHVAIRSMVPEEVRLLLLRIGYLRAVLDVALAADDVWGVQGQADKQTSRQAASKSSPVDDADVAEAQWDDAIHEHLGGVGARIHEV